MRQIEKVAAVLVVLMILSLLPIHVLLFIMRNIDSASLKDYPYLFMFVQYAPRILRLIISLGVGIWLFILARREKAVPWIWLLFGLTFGLIAAVLYFILRVYDSVKPAESTTEA